MRKFHFLPLLCSPFEPSTVSMEQNAANPIFEGAQSYQITWMVIDNAVELRFGYLLQLKYLVLLLLQALQRIPNVSSLGLHDELRCIVAHGAKAVSS